LRRRVPYIEVDMYARPVAAHDHMFTTRGGWLSLLGRGGDCYCSQPYLFPAVCDLKSVLARSDTSGWNG
jgi:hypothetical protein